MRGKMFVGTMIVLLAISGIAFAGLSVESYTVTPSTVKLGEEGSVSFTIKNVLPSSSTTTISPLEDITVYYSNVGGIEFKSKSPFVVGTIDSGGSALVTIPFKVLPTAKGGIATASFFISQKDKTELKTVNAAIKVVNEPILTISSEQTTVLSTDTLNLTITNNGGKASKFYLRIYDGSDFSIIGKTQIYVGEIETEAHISLPIDSRNVEEGVSNIPFVLTYLQEGGDSINVTKYLPIAVKKEKADVVFSQTEPIITSRENVLVLKVKNIGRQLEEFEIHLTDDEIKPKEAKEIKLGDFASGKEMEIRIKVFADAQPGVMNAKFTLKWVEDDVEKEEEKTVPIVVNSDADVAIFIDAKPAPLIPGGEHNLAILVSNIGSYKIQNVEVGLDENIAYEIFNAQKSQYIGGLESDDFSTVQYKIRINEIAPGAHPITVFVKYKDQSGEWIEKNETIQVMVRPKEDGANGDSGDPTLTIVIVLAIAAGVGYWWFKLRKKNGNKNNTK